MPRFSDRAIALARKYTEEALTDTCSIIAISSIVEDGAGHWSESTTTTNNVACRVLPLDRQTQDSMVAEQEVNRSYYTLVLKHDQAITSGAKIVHNSITYEVKQLLKAAQTDKADKQVIIVRVD